MADSYRPAQPFRLVSWLRRHGVDLITMALMGALGLGIYKARQSGLLTLSQVTQSPCSPRPKQVFPHLL